MTRRYKKLAARVILAILAGLALGSFAFAQTGIPLSLIPNHNHRRTGDGGLIPGFQFTGPLYNNSNALGNIGISTSIYGPALLWYPPKTALRAGSFQVGELAPLNMGTDSFAAGYSVTAGTQSMSLGSELYNQRFNSILLGQYLTNRANNSIMIGYGQAGGGGSIINDSTGSIKLIPYYTTSSTQAAIAAYADGRIELIGATRITGSLSITTATITGPLSLSSATVTGPLTVIGSATISGTASFGSSVTVTGQGQFTDGSGAVAVNTPLTTAYASLLFQELGAGKAEIAYIPSGYVTTSRQKDLEIVGNSAGDITLWPGGLQSLALDKSGHAYFSDGITLVGSATVQGSAFSVAGSTFSIGTGVSGFGARFSTTTLTVQGTSTQSNVFAVYEPGEPRPALTIGNTGIIQLETITLNPDDDEAFSVRIATNAGAASAGNYSIMLSTQNGVFYIVSPTAFIQAPNDTLWISTHTNKLDGPTISAMNSARSAHKALEIQSADLQMGGTNGIKFGIGGTGGTDSQITIVSTGTNFHTATTTTTFAGWIDIGLVQKSSATSASNQASLTASCDAGYKVLGGGYASNPTSKVPYANYPSGSGAWTVAWWSTSDAPWTAYAICARVK